MKTITKELIEEWVKFQDMKISSLGRVERYGIIYSGTPHLHGYMKVFIKNDINISKRSIGVHRLIGHLFLGLDLSRSDLMVDHINGNKTDNRIQNLRIVTMRENQSNQVMHREGKIVGVGLVKNTSRWYSRIRVGGKLKHLGYFDTKIEAQLAYIDSLKNIDSIFGDK